MQGQVPLPLLREAGDGKGRMRGRGRPAAGRARGGAIKPVLERADGAEAQLAPIVINAKARNGGLSGLGPLPATGRRGQVAPVGGFPAVANLTSALGAGVPFDDRAYGGCARHKDGPVLGGGQASNIEVEGGQAQGETCQLRAICVV